MLHSLGDNARVDPRTAEEEAHETRIQNVVAPKLCLIEGTVASPLRYGFTEDQLLTRLVTKETHAQRVMQLLRKRDGRLSELATIVYSRLGAANRMRMGHRVLSFE
jgi:hypothetical protein